MRTLFVLGLAAASLPAAGPAFGPYRGVFLRDGLGISKPLAGASDLARATSPWTLSAWVFSSEPVSDTLLAGFGTADASGRFLAIREGRLAFLSDATEVRSRAALASREWQLLTATFDGTTLHLYHGGEEVAASQLALRDTIPSVSMAPVKLPWQGTHFAGRIAGFSFEGRAWSPQEIRSQLAQAATIEALPFEAASKSWPVQVKGQPGLLEPQDPRTLPRWSATPRAGVARPVPDRPALEARGPFRWALSGRWRMMPSPAVAAGGERISRPGFDAAKWYPAVVPGTALTTMVERGVYPDPDFGLDNLAIPESLNRQDYWYRVEFPVPKAAAGRRLRLLFGGINYAAEVWLNGRRLGSIRGAFQRASFDVTREAAGGTAVVAVRVSPPPHPGIPHEQSMAAGAGPNGGMMCLDGPTFICTEGWDWIPGVRDRNTGIWQEVSLIATGAVGIGDVTVTTRLPLPDTSRATIDITVPLHNQGPAPVDGIVRASFEGAVIERHVRAAPGDSQVRFTTEVRRPRLWWPNGYGRPELYHLTVSFADSDAVNLRFGIREIRYELTLMDAHGHLRRVEYAPAAAPGQRVVDVRHEALLESVEGWVASLAAGAEMSPALRTLEDRRASPYLVLRVNGVRIVCKGGNWGLDDSRKRVSRERLEPFVRLHRDAHFTMIRNWQGQNTESTLFDLCDEYGLLVWNDFWIGTQDWNLEPADTKLFLDNARDTIQRFRHHPSIAIWCGRNEGVPAPALNEGLDELVRQWDGTRYYIPNSRLINLQTSGPWSYGDPVEFFSKRGMGFSTELGLPSVPTIDALRSMLPAGDLWPPNDTWAYHDWHNSQNGLVPVNAAIAQQLGDPTDLRDFSRKVQLLQYASHRAVFEGLNARLWAPNSGRLLWMTQPAWPSMVWQVMSFDYDTHGSYYGARKGCEPVHIQLDLPQMKVAVVNAGAQPISRYLARARVYSIGGRLLSQREEKITVAGASVAELWPLNLWEQSPLVFVVLDLADANGRLVSDNFYWEAKTPADYQGLNSLPTASVQLTAHLVPGQSAPRVEVELSNPGTGIAFFNHVVLRGKDGRPILPAYAEENYLSLLPGERRKVVIETPVAIGEGWCVTVEGWNVPSALFEHRSP